MSRAKRARAVGPDWEVIEREYRAGQLSIRQIARIQGIAESGLRKRAEKYGWARDLSDAVRRRVQDDLVRSAHPAHPAASDEAIIDHAAARGVEVVRQHRDHLGRLHRIAYTVAQQLELLLTGAKLDIPFIGLKESPADVLVKVAQATAKWLPLEREAFGLDKGEGEKPRNPAASAIDWRTLFEKAGIAESAN
ncbi:MAG: hypothetical protein ACREVJ_10420, partial [Gammaproteobacteria bacterium]